MGETCETCRFWEYHDHGGHCRRYPPTPMYQVALDGSGGSYGTNLLPWTVASDWCGEHSPKAPT